MKLEGLLLLLAGWAILVIAIGLLPPGPARSAFALAGVGVEGLGMALVSRAHIPTVEKRPEEQR